MTLYKNRFLLKFLSIISKAFFRLHIALLLFFFFCFSDIPANTLRDTLVTNKSKEASFLTGFTFDCANVTVNSDFYASGVAQSGTITIPIRSVTAGTTRIVVTNSNGFSGGLTTTTIAATQTFVLIPITYTGLSAEGTFNLIISSPNATNSCTVSVRVLNCSAYAPKITTNVPSMLCIGDSVTMTASTGTRYRWSTGETTASVMKKAAATYTVTVTANGCTAAVSNTVSINTNCEAGFCSGILNSNGLKITFGTGERTSLQNAVAGATTTHIYSPTGVIVDGQYSVANNGIAAGGWAADVPDLGGDSIRGRLMVINADNTPKECFRIPISGLCSNLKYEFSAWIRSISNKPDKPNITFEIREAATENLLAIRGTGNVPYGDWYKYGMTFNTTSSNDLILILRNNNRGGLNGNDFVVDDIQFAYCGPPTVLTIEGGSFNASKGEAIVCPSTPITIKSAVTPGFITVPQYQWQESTDNGTTWSNIAGATSATYSLTATSALAGRRYQLLVAEAGRIGNPSCRVNSNMVHYTLAGGVGTITANRATTFCTGDSVVLTAASGVRYNWSTGANTRSITVSTNGTYDVTVTDAGGCTSKASQNITVNTKPTGAITVVGEANLNVGGTAVLTASGGDRYVWNNGLTTASIIINSKGTYTVTITNTTTGCSSIASKTVDASNFAPILTNATPSVSEDVTLAGNLSPNATDADGNLDPNSFVLIALPKNGIFTLNPTGSYTYTPNPNFNGKDSVQVRVCDVSGACDTATVTITVSPVNDTPILTNATPSIQEDTPITSTVAPNASDPDGDLDNKSFAILDSPLNGTLTMKPDGTYTYTPKPNFNGQDSAHYKVCDLTGACATATLIFTVNPVNDAPIFSDATPSVQEDTPVSGTFAPNARDVDGNLNPNSFTLLDNPKNGTISLKPDGTYTYTPNPNFNGMDSIRIRVCDLTALCDTATVVFTVNAVNDAPILKNGSVTLDEDGSVTNTVKPNANDADGNLNPTSFVLIDNPLKGTITMKPDGGYTYTPKPDFSGTDSVHYQVCDLSGACSQATLIFTVNPVNDPPNLLNATPSTDEDTPITGTVKPFANDIDGNLNNNSFAVLDLPKHGSIIMNPNGTYTYTPKLNFNGVDSVHYRVCDLGGLCTTATIIIEVSSTNDAPILRDATISGNEDNSIGGNVKPNATDVDGNLNPNGFSILDVPLNGVITMKPDGTFTYTPNPDFNGTDSVHYRVCDLAGSCTSATLIFNVMPVNDPPNLANATPSVSEDIPLTGNVAPNASDADGNLNPNSFAPLSLPKNGNFILNPNGTFVYTPNPNFYGVDTVRYRVCDMAGACDTALIIFNINPINDPPTLITASVSVLEDTEIAGTTLQNVSDPDNNIDLQSFKLLDAPSQGTITMKPDGTFSYTPFKNFNGIDSVRYRVCDKAGACTTGTLIINVLPANDPPKATVNAPIVAEDTPTTFCGIISDLDAGEVFSTRTCNTTPNGSINPIISNNQLCITYIPSKDFNGVDSICLLVCDKSGACDTVRLPVTVTPMNDIPRLIVTPIEVPADSTVIQCFTINDPDMGEVFTASICGTKEGTARVKTENNNLCVTYKVNNLNATTDTICVILCDKMGACSQANIPVVIKPCNDQFEPIISCPEPVEVSHIGTIISDPSNFLTNVSVSDNCLGVKVTFKTPTATDDCMSNPIVQQTSGNMSGSVFLKGTSNVFFEAVDKTGKKAACVVPITVSHAELITDETAKLCLTDVLVVPALPLSNAVYLWKGTRNFTSTSATLTLPLTNVNMSGLYTLTATYGRNCTLKDSINLSVNDIPALKNDTFSLAVGGTVKGNVLTNDTLNSTAYKLNIMFNVKNGTLQINNEGIMTYKAAATFKGIEYFSYEVCTEQCPNTCPKADGILNILTDYKQPLLTADEVITPNEDGYNDALVINDFDASDPDNTSSIIIYNQWGGIVYQAAPYLNDWNGTYKDAPLPTGTYYYIFKKDNTTEPLKSFITILR